MMEHLVQIIAVIFASTGFWAVVNTVIQGRRDKKTAFSEKIKVIEAGVRGLLHEKLIERSEFFLSRGEMTESEYRDLEEYIYLPYKGLNGNGTGDEYMKRCRELLFQKGDH